MLSLVYVETTKPFSLNHFITVQVKYFGSQRNLNLKFFVKFFMSWNGYPLQTHNFFIKRLTKNTKKKKWWQKQWKENYQVYNKIKKRWFERVQKCTTKKFYFLKFYV